MQRQLVARRHARAAPGASPEWCTAVDPHRCPVQPDDLEVDLDRRVRLRRPARGPPSAPRRTASRRGVSPIDAVPHGGGGVVAPRPEVALPVDQRVAHRPGLGQPHEGVVDRAVAVRVVVAHHLADHARALDVRAVGTEAVLPHRVQDAPVHRLEPVLDQRQSATDDHAHRVVDVRALHLLLDVDRLDPVAAAGGGGRARYGRHGRVQGVRHEDLLLLRGERGEIGDRDVRRPGTARPWRCG